MNCKYLKIKQVIFIENLKLSFDKLRTLSLPNGKSGKYVCGQALVTLLFFTVIATTVTTGAIIVIFTNTIAQTKIQQSQSAYYIAESGAENALIRLIRNPAYTGETMTIGEGSTTIQITGNNPYTVMSTGTVGSFVRKIQVVAIYTSNVFTVQSWKEIF